MVMMIVSERLLGSSLPSLHPLVTRSLPSSGEARSLRDDTTGEGTDEGNERDMEAGIRRILPVERALREERPQGEGTPERVQP